MITVSDVVEYMYCPRFVYFERVLGIPQHEEKREKVLIGRNIHELKEKINKNYIRKSINAKAKFLNVYLSSKKYRIVGIVDEVLELEDGSYAPLDYKFAEYKNKLFKTHKYQSILYGLLIKENFNVEVNRGFVVYVRSGNLVKEIKFKQKDFDDAIGFIDLIFDIIENEEFPLDIKVNKRKCIDCCYRNRTFANTFKYLD
ncbi:CRISPR-associated protein Cas4 [Methanotorris formicicus Mc-S-70]|uniref:CRISPR-associated exonuclease Cas4 n=2 Tax=Methanotorris formicicus TaxID=213185 RepID=H1L0B1_9EURY|nr:CRISPR-associated protein Cas4 [Methanotorris formicicus Mc-S-70]